MDRVVIKFGEKRFISRRRLIAMGCRCSVCTHRYVCDCEGAYCNCCLESEHRVDTIVTDEDEISHMSETKYIFTPA